MATRKQQAAEKRLAAAKEALAAAQAEAVAAGLVVEAPAVHVEQTHSDTVYVCCKMPNGLLLRLHEEATVDMPVFGGGMKPRKVFMAIPDETVRLRPATVPFGKLPNFPIIGNYSITKVKRDFWEKWLAQNSKLDLVVKNMVFAMSDQASAEARAREQAKVLSNLEPINPDGDARTKEGDKNANLSNVEVDDERDARKVEALT